MYIHIHLRKNKDNTDCNISHNRVPGVLYVPAKTKLSVRIGLGKYCGQDDMLSWLPIALWFAGEQKSASSPRSVETTALIVVYFGHNWLLRVQIVWLCVHHAHRPRLPWVHMPPPADSEGALRLLVSGISGCACTGCHCPRTSFAFQLAGSSCLYHHVKKLYLDRKRLLEFGFLWLGNGRPH
ncbi:uncharacterized protein G2W53_040720 [Senna tora]|uniref:Uncharacterized protein n=1 Tax=Senna tora TaxID=362788 RepID=A0A834SE43_9FABA|nr:uncharacterized protein G2W53_040720 [Senna tora]